MAKTARTKTTAANLPVPQDRNEAAATVSAIGELTRQLTRMETDMNDAISAVKELYEAKAAPVKLAIAEKTDGLSIWAEANRAKLTGGEKTKTVDLGTGVLRWRLRPPSVSISKVTDTLERIRALGLLQFIRIKEEIDKEAMLREPDLARTIAGVRIGSPGEDFIVETFEAQLSSDVAGA